MGIWSRMGRGGFVALAAAGLASLASPATARAQAAVADQIWVDGNILTGDPANPRVEAMAISDGLVMALGTEAEIRKLAGKNTRTQKLQGNWVLPGLIDCHGHLMGLGLYGLGQVDLSTARSYDDVVEMVRQVNQQIERDRWLLGGRWDHESWPDHKLPTHQALSNVTPKRAVWLKRIDGHAALTNQYTMQVCGISKDTPDPPGGEIIRDENGDPTGVFVDRAMDLIESQMQVTLPDSEDILMKAQELCLQAGLTTVHQAGASPAELEVMKKAVADGKLKLRVYAMVGGLKAARWMAENEPLVGDRLSIRALKLYADGAMGSRGALLLAPYADRPKNAHGEDYVGLAVTAPEELRSLAALALERGYQVCTHAIGDRANREVLDLYESLTKGYDPARLRWRIEHAQLLSEQDIPRFAKLGVIASMQPTHATSDMRWVLARVGTERAKWAYPWKSLLDSGARIAFGSDFPVEPQSPLLGIYAAITRQDVYGNPKEGFNREQCLTREQALKGYTLDAAYASFEEGSKGSLAPGKLADFIVVDKDIMSCKDREIPSTSVKLTVVGGEVVARGGKGVKKAAH